MNTLSCTRPPCSAQAGILPRTFVLQDLYSITRVRLTRWASFRMPSDETLRISLVCMLPLRRFSPSLVAVTPELPCRLSTTPKALKKLAAPHPQFDALARSRGVHIWHEFTSLGITFRVDFASWCPNPRSVPVRPGRFLSLIATSGVYFQKLTLLGGLPQVRRASCRGMSPKRYAPISSAPTCPPFHWRLRQSYLWLGFL